MIEALMRSLGWVPKSLYDSEKSLRISAQERSYEFFDKYNALKIEKEIRG